MRCTVQANAILALSKRPIAARSAFLMGNFLRATHGTRTHDPRITNAMLYQLS